LRTALTGTLVIAVVLLLSACRTVAPIRVPGREAPAAGCHDVTYEGHFDPAGEEDRRFLRLFVRGCRDGGGPVVFEVRGRVGGPVVAGAVGGGRLLLLFPRERRAVRGADDPAVWRRWAGVPVEESLLRRTLSAGTAGGRVEQLGAWRVEVQNQPGESWRVEARSESGDRLTLERERQEPVERRPAWPEVPKSFEVVRAGPGGDVLVQ
jgi:hypothetical protein